MKIRKGDPVIITIGKDKGKKGKVEDVDAKGSRVLISGLNIYKRHQKRRDDKHPSGIIEFPRALALGKIALVCPSCQSQTRVGFLMAGGDKYRVCRKCGQRI